MDMLILDLSRAFPGTAGPLIAGFADRAAASRNTETIAFYKPSQADEIASHSFTETILLDELLQPTGVAHAVSEAVLAKLRNVDATYYNSINVFSFHAVVRAACENLRRAHPSITFETYSPLDLSARSNKTSTYYAWPTELMSLDKAIEILSRLLEKHGAIDPSKGIRLTDLRPFLAREEERFAKGYNVASSRPGLISMLTNEACRRGNIKMQDVHGDNNPVVWLPNNDRADQNDSLTQDQPASTAILKVSDQFLATWRSQDMGPFSHVRDHLYNSIQDLAAGGKEFPQSALTLNQLIARAVDQTKERFAERASAGEKKSYPWRYVRAFLTRLLSKVAILQSIDGTEVKASLATMAIPIVDCKDGWRDSLDGELVVSLLEAGQTVTLFDIRALAGALYHDRNPDTEDRVVRVLSKLQRDGRIVESSCNARKLQLRQPS